MQKNAVAANGIDETLAANHDDRGASVCHDAAKVSTHRSGAHDRDSRPDLLLVHSGQLVYVPIPARKLAGHSCPPQRWQNRLEIRNHRRHPLRFRLHSQ